CHCGGSQRMARETLGRRAVSVPGMWAVTTTGDGGAEVLRWSEVPDPEPGPGDVLVEVAASAVNRADLMQRQGFYPPPPGASPLLGLECAGEVEAVGAEVRGWHVGDRAMALLQGGGYAEKVAVHYASAMRVHDALSDEVVTE